MNKYKKGFFNVGYSKNTADYNVTIVPISTYSAKYLKGTKKAYKKLIDSSLVYANMDGSCYPLKIYNPDYGYMLKKTKVNTYPIIKCFYKNLDKKLCKESENLGKGLNIFVGSDHSVSYYILKNLYKNQDIKVVQFDAHSDYIDEFKTYAHGSVMCEINKFSNIKKIYHIGLRGNLNSEPATTQSKQNNNTIITKQSLHTQNYQLDIKNENLYLSIDVDFFDSSIISSTGCIEPDGVLFNDALKLFASIIQNNNIVGIDIVEYDCKKANSNHDASYIVNLIIYLMNFMENKNEK